jgi:Tol biopolymer transport system component
MPARTTPFRVHTIVIALSLAVAACDGGDNPLAPAGGDLAAPESSAPASEASAIVEGAAPEFLTAGSGPRILFSSSRSGFWDLYRMAPDGTGVVRVTSFSSLDGAPAWNVLHRDIYLMNADGSGKRWIESQPSSARIMNPSWSPDGTRLVVSVEIPDVPQLMLMNVATGAMSFIVGAQGAVSGFYPSFDPTGKKIVYLSSNYSSIETVNVDGSGHTVIMAGAPYEFQTPRYSPDGKRLAFARRVSGNQDIYVRTLATGTIKRLTFNTSDDYAPTWSSDGSRIAFNSFRAGPSQIYTVSSAGGTQTRITHTTTQEAEPAWSH